MTMCFRYIHGGSKLIPIIPIKLKYKNKELPITALIDTGADYTFIPDDVARILDIKYNRFQEERITGIDKELICARCPVTLIIEKDGEKHEIEIIAQIPKQSAKKVGVLLGRQGFFENFNINFCEGKGDIYIEKN